MAGTWQISNDAMTAASGSASSISTSLSHASNALIIIASGIRLTSSSAISTCSVGGVAATKLTALSNGTIRGEVWAIFRSAASTGETVAVGITPTNKQAFIAASFTGAKNASPFIVQGQAATATGTASAVSVTKGAGAKNQRVLMVVANVGTTTIDSVGTGQTLITNAGTTGGPASTNAKVHLNFEDAANTTAQVQTAGLSAAATNASIAIGLLPLLTATDKNLINDYEKIRTSKVIKDIVRGIADTESTITTFARVLADFLRIEDIKEVIKAGPQIFTVTIADALSIVDYHAKAIIKTLAEAVDTLEELVRKTVGKQVGCEPSN